MKRDSAVERGQFLGLVLVDPLWFNTAAFIWFKVQGLSHFNCLLNQQSLI